MHKTILWYLGFRPPPYSDNWVFDQKIRAKNASEFEQICGVRTLGLQTEKSRVESKRNPRSISREQKEQSGAETHSANRILIKEKRNCPARFTSKEEREKRKNSEGELPSLI